MATLKDQTTVGGDQILDYVDSAASAALDYSNQNHEYALEQILKIKPQFAQDSTEATAQRGEEQDFSTVYNTWTRISHANGQRPYSTSELNAWTYDETNDQIICTDNTSSLVGFVSPDGYDDYVFDVIVNSSSGDDDFIGLIIAYAEDTDGIGHTLTAMRAMSDTHNDVFYITMNFSDNNTSLPYLNIARIGTDVITSPNGWSGVSSGARIRAERTGDTVVIKTSEVDNTDQFISGAQIDLNLTDYPELSVFRGPARVGYCARSQPNSTYNTLTRPVALDDVYDIQNDVIWSYDSEQEQWTSRDANNEQYLEPNRFYWNYTTKRLFFVDGNENVHRVALYNEL